MLEKGSKVGIACCSNGQPPANRDKIDLLEQTLKDIGLVPVFSEYIYEKESVFSGCGKERAEALMDFYRDKNIKAIFDISGGDIANEILNYLDFNIIKCNRKPFFGYSDLTVIINAIYAKTGCPSYLYQARNLIYDYKEQQIADFKNSILMGKNDLFDIKYEFLQGDCMEGVTVGGNIRCLLKLAGTPFMPDMKNKILLLESCGGETALISSHLNHLKQLGAFKKINGILLGTFTAMEKNECYPTAEELVIDIVDDKALPVAKTKDIGHGGNSKCMIIGDSIKLLNKNM